MITASLLSGVVIGICLTLGLQVHFGNGAWASVANFLPSSSADRATLIAGFGGAALGGVISWILAKQAANEGLQRDQIQRLNSDKAAALRTILKLQYAAGGIFSLLMYINNQVKLARENGDQSLYIFDKVLPSAGYDKMVEFSTDDLLLFVQEGRAEIINGLSMLAQRHSASLAAMKVYSDLRVELAELAAKYTSFNHISAVHKTEFIGDDALKARMKIESMERLIREIWKDLKEEHANGVALCREVNEFYSKYFAKHGGFVALQVVEPTSSD